MQVTGDAGPRGDAGATLGDGATADAGVTTEDVGAPGDAAMRGDAAAATPDAGMPCVPHAETCNERDDDCDGRVDEESTMVTFYADGDHDGHGAGVARLACVAPAMTAASADDCDDTDASRHPGATETCDGVDSNCDGSIDTELMRAYFVDADADGFGVDGTSVSACSPSGTHSATTAGDCDDSCATCHLGGIEVCDGRDQDCMLGADNGVQLVFYRDADSDTFGDASTTATACAAPVGYVTTATDCLDSNATVHPGAAEVCNAIDDNCVCG